MSVRAHVIQGDALNVLGTLPDGAARCCVTSPPYWGLRDYGVPGQLGLEQTPEEYVANLVQVFREVRRVLADDGTLWLNLGDSYAANPGQRKPTDKAGAKQQTKRGSTGSPSRDIEGLAAKNLIGIPWRVAFALQADGWWLRSDIVWSKPNAMPESVTDRPTRAHEYVFLLSKSARYFYDAAAIRTPWTSGREDMRTKGLRTGRAYLEQAMAPSNDTKPDKQRGHSRRHAGFNDRWDAMERKGQVMNGANARTVWEIATQPYLGAHFATFPEELARRCILAGSAPGDSVLDPFAGSGTVGAVAVGNGRSAILIELKAEYLELARQRIGDAEAQGLLELGGAR